MPPDDSLAALLLDALLGGRRPDDATAARLAELGLTRLDVAARLTDRWLSLVGPATCEQELLPALLPPLLEAPDPDGAMLAFGRLDEQIGGITLGRWLADDPRFARDLLFLLGFGAWTAEALLRDPGLVDLVLDRDAVAAPLDAAAERAAAARRLRGVRRVEHRLDALRRWKREQFLRLILRDRLHHVAQRRITAEISTVADIACGLALELAAEEVLGRPDGAGAPAGLAVIAMGKWGSQELNYNSDIDLLCVFEPRPDSPTADAWAAVVRRLTALLGEATGEGRLFRVDHRLRPEGDAGPLVRSLEGYAAYLREHGAAWESQALTRARFCAGDAALGRRFEQLAQQAAFGTRVGREGVALIRRNRQRLLDRARGTGDIKEGPGGIREIEFTVQLLQLVRGVTDPAVRRRNTWDALEALAQAGAITQREAETLAEAYDYLRQVEHLLQLQPAAPTRRLPTNAAARRRLARGMGYRDAGPRSAVERFEAALASHTSAARQLGERLFYNPVPLSSPEAQTQIAELLDPLQAADEVIEHLAPVGFDEPAAARQRLLYLAYGEPPMRLPEEIQALFIELLPALLSCIQRMPDPDAALRWFERFISRAGGREPFYRFLVEHPPLIELLCRIGGFSDQLSQLLVDYPEYLNNVVNPAFLTAELEPELLRRELDERLRPIRKPDLRLDDLRRFRRREAFRIGVRDLLESLVTEQVTRDLSLLAEVCLERLLVEVLALVPDAAGLPFAIIACGKLGGRELHYSSDLDVLFVYEPGEQGPMAATLAERLARELTHQSDRRTRAGRLFELDSRLRPHGGNSPLTRSLTGYRKYWQQQAQPWERLALTRARPVAGDADLGRRFCDAAAEFVFGPPPAEAQLDDIRRIKQRIETERRKVTDLDHLDVKLEPGGLMDLEFLVQILQIQHGGARPEVRRANTAEALAALASAGVLGRDTAQLLMRAYAWYRRLETRLQLVGERSGALLPLDAGGLAATAKRLGWATREAETRPAQLVADIRERQRAVRAVYESVIGLAG